MARPKLTDSQQIQLVQFYHENISATKLAEMFSVSTTTITNTLTRLGVNLRSRSNTQALFREQFKNTDGYKIFLDKISAVHKGKVLSTQSREKMSKSRAEGIANGTINSRCYGKAQWYQGFYCRSSWEVEFVKLAKIRGWDLQSCKIVIPYVFNNITRNYIPDFVSEVEREVYEIKPIALRDTKMNKAKFAAAEQWCIYNNYRFKVITEWTIFNKRGFREDYR